MRESCTSGSVRGARGNSRPYRNMPVAAVQESGSGTLRRIAAVRRFGRDRSEADMPRASEGVDLTKMTQSRHFGQGGKHRVPPSLNVETARPRGNRMID